MFWAESCRQQGALSSRSVPDCVRKRVVCVSDVVCEMLHTLRRHTLSVLDAEPPVHGNSKIHLWSTESVLTLWRYRSGVGDAQTGRLTTHRRTATHTTHMTQNETHRHTRHTNTQKHIRNTPTHMTHQHTETHSDTQRHTATHTAPPGPSASRHRVYQTAPWPTDARRRGDLGPSSHHGGQRSAGAPSPRGRSRPLSTLLHLHIKI